MRTIAFLILLTLGPLEAKVVHGLFFYGESCAHCHALLDKEMPELIQEYGRELDLRLVNVNTKVGHRLFQQTLRNLSIDPQKAGVPMVVIGDQAFIGRYMIAEKLPLLIEKHLGTGIPAPSIPNYKNLRRITANTRLSPQKDDPFANLLAILLLLIMMASIISVGLIWLKKGLPTKRSPWIPLLALLGLAIAIYLSYLELTGRKGICGPVGDCDEVQQSPYSTVLGIPIGFIGFLGYLAILIAWFWKSKRWLLPLFLMIGTLFSLYLTFLEPFIIRAVCFWCLTSATIMTLLLWLHIPLHKKSLE